MKKVEEEKNPQEKQVNFAFSRTCPNYNTFITLFTSHLELFDIHNLILYSTENFIALKLVTHPRCSQR